MKRIRKLAVLAATVGLLLTGAAGLSQAEDRLGSGNFSGKSNHVASGTVDLVQTDRGYEIRLGDDFRFDGAPDPKVMIGTRGSKQRLQLSHLARNSGAQTYALPAGVEPGSYDEVWIWCKRYSVPLAYARLKRP